MDDVKPASITDTVKEYYGRVLKTSADLKTSACCLAETLPPHVLAALKDVHDEVKDRFYGCGLPIPPALEGITVLDLGCGSGRDCYVLSRLVGSRGRVIGLDMTDEQMAVARRHGQWHADKFGHKTPNTEFRQGYYLPEFFAKHRCEVIASLPCYQEYFTDAQRGSGVFKKSIEGIRRLNALGYGLKGSGLVLNLVYNPVGPYLPPPQASLEADYKKQLKEKFGLVFNSLFTITNMPINRFKLHLDKSGQYEEYMEKLLNAFNPAAAEGVMCRSLISVDHEGVIYDCDFNQMLDMKVGNGKGPATIFDFDFDALMQRRIRFDSHCFGCTAGAGSSCGGATA